ncbi:hypothetical protein M9H77_36597 [Catharanthus roseus]|uniref:Uncharacterized protein n=1 Tax=Catharanthus roseus TaxID=4058 RepID=A0ACB9ZUF8_CATRO|nr:hypothetical protein M9H77_36597 [Catharanthus roseus]
MDPLAEIYKILLRTRSSMRKDNVPCKIEEVVDLTNLTDGLYLGSFGAASNKSALKSLNITHILTVANSLSPLHPNGFVYKIVSSMIFHLILFLLPYLVLFVSVAGARASEVGNSVVGFPFIFTGNVVLKIVKIMIQLPTSFSDSLSQSNSDVNNSEMSFELDHFLKAISVFSLSDREDVNISQYFEDCFEFIEEAKKSGGGVLVHCFLGRSRSATIVVAYLMKKHGMSLAQALAHVKERRPVAGPNSGFIAQLQNLEKTLQALSKKLHMTIALYHNET